MMNFSPDVLEHVPVVIEDDGVGPLWPPLLQLRVQGAPARLRDETFAFLHELGQLPAKQPDSESGSSHPDSEELFDSGDGHSPAPSSHDSLDFFSYRSQTPM